MAVTMMVASAVDVLVMMPGTELDENEREMQAGRCEDAPGSACALISTYSAE